MVVIVSSTLENNLFYLSFIKFDDLGRYYINQRKVLTAIRDYLIGYFQRYYVYCFEKSWGFLLKRSTGAPGSSSFIFWKSCKMCEKIYKNTLGISSVIHYIMFIIKSYFVFKFHFFISVLCDALFLVYVQNGQAVRLSIFYFLLK